MADFQIDQNDDFWKKVEIRGPDDCWLWQGLITSFGYGTNNRPRRQMFVHRRAYELAYGVRLSMGSRPTKEDVCVCHSCDVRHCCNPRHLWLGTRGDNNRDRAAKGRSAVRPHKARLFAEDIPTIREQLAMGETFQAIADSHGVNPGTIHHIATGKTWKHVP